jgi:hypothetical protein
VAHEVSRAGDGFPTASTSVTSAHATCTSCGTTLAAVSRPERPECAAASRGLSYELDCKPAVACRSRVSTSASGVWALVRPSLILVQPSVTRPRQGADPSYPLRPCMLAAASFDQPITNSSSSSPGAQTDVHSEDDSAELSSIDSNSEFDDMSGSLSHPWCGVRSRRP